MAGTCLSSVIAGLDPAIHLLRKILLAKRMDPRVKPAGDAREWVDAESIRTGAAELGSLRLRMSLSETGSHFSGTCAQLGVILIIEVE
jgi:hypothetical protein